jgi:hypothetical protein
MECRTKESAADLVGRGAKGEHRGTLFAKVRGKPYVLVKARSVPTASLFLKLLIPKAI